MFRDCDWGNDDSSKPRISKLVESAEKRLKDQFDNEVLLDASCIAVATFLFGPLEALEEELYASMIKKRILDYRMSLH